MTAPDRKVAASTVSLAAKPKGGAVLAWLADHRRVASDTATFVSQRILRSFLVWLMVGIALTLPGLLWIAQSNLQAFGGQWQGSAGLTVYMNVGARDSQVRDLALKLQEHSAVQRFVLTTPEEALDQLLTQSDDSQFLRGALAAIETNPLPASFSVVLEVDTSYLQLDALSRQLLALPGVDDVEIQSAWIERLRDLGDLANRVGGGLSVILLVAAVLVTFASVRLAIESKLAELRVLALVGATASQMRRPFLYFGASYGIGGGIMAILLIALFLNQIEAPLKSLLISYQVGVSLAGFTPSFLLAVVLAGWFLGIFGALLALSQRLGDLGNQTS
ncbi:MAG: permease-like cell division protein FtsX [Gammaproteobacteria bacterium]|jgi:cell division transport system permease protein